MGAFLHVLLIVAIILLLLSVISFVIYHFKLDMKLTAAIEPWYLSERERFKDDQQQ